MESTLVYKKKYYIGLSDIDFAKKLKLSALFNYFQDIASLAAENLGVGVTEIGEKFGVTWALTRVKVDILRSPEWNEEITIETWPLEPEKLEFERDFIVRDRDGNIIIRAVSKWIIFDIKTRRLKKTELIGLKYPDIITERSIDCEFEKLKPLGEFETAYKKVVGYSDIDLNEHLNNSRYVDFIMDCFDLESHKKYGIKTIDVSYINEALPGDTIILNKDISSLNSNLIYIEGFNESDNKVIFKALVEIKAK